MNMLIEALKAILYGIVQGVTEWLPISSTGHMLLLDQIISFDTSDAFREFFLVAVQFGSMLAVPTLFWRKLCPFCRGQSKAERTDIYKTWGKVCLASVPVAVVGFFFDEFLTEHLYTPTVIAIALIVYGVFFILLSRYKREGTNEVTLKRAVGIGCFQVLSLIPGTSRSGSTILGGVVMGVSNTDAAEFSFFLALPAMCGATALRLFAFLYDGFVFTATEILILAVGAVTAYLISLFALRFLLSIVRSHGLAPFGWYRIVLGALVILLQWV